MKAKNSDMHDCLSCAQATLSEVGVFEICSVCLWKNDPVQSADPKYAGGANQLCLEEARQKYMERKSK